MRNERAWNDDEVEYLTAMWRDGWSATHIGRKLNRTRNSIIGKVHRLHLPGHKEPSGPRRHPPAAAKRAAA